MPHAALATRPFHSSSVRLSSKDQPFILADTWNINHIFQYLLDLPRHTPLLRILLRRDPLILSHIPRLPPQLLKLLLIIHRPNILPQLLMPFPIFLYPLLNRPLIQFRAVRFIVWAGGVGRDGREGRVVR